MLGTLCKVAAFALAVGLPGGAHAQSSQIVVPEDIRVIVRALTNSYDRRGVLRQVGLPPAAFERLILTQMWQESRFRVRARSHANAQGLMQLIPSTARMMGVSDSYDPVQNITGGVRYFVIQLQKFGCVEHALGAYNAGPHRIEKYRGLPPFRETRDYVRIILSRSGLAQMQPYSRNRPIPAGRVHCVYKGEGATGVTTTASRIVTGVERARAVPAARTATARVERRALPSHEPGLLTDENWTPPRPVALREGASLIRSSPVVYSSRGAANPVLADGKEMLVQLGVFRRPDWHKLDEEQRRLRALNVPAFVEEYISDGGRRYRRLLAGPFRTREDRQTILDYVRGSLGMKDAFAWDRRFFETQPT